MPITVTWENEEKNIVYVCHKQPITLQEHDASHRETQQLIASVPHTVHIIMDLRGGDVLPPNAISRFRERAKNRLENQGRIVLVGGNMFDKTVADVIGKTTHTIPKGNEMLFANTREEALALLKTTP